MKKGVKSLDNAVDRTESSLSSAPYLSCNTNLREAAYKILKPLWTQAGIGTRYFQNDGHSPRWQPGKAAVD
jgi:hypothetical protein